MEMSEFESRQFISMLSDGETKFTKEQLDENFKSVSIALKAYKVLDIILPIADGASNKEIQLNMGLSRRITENRVSKVMNDSVNLPKIMLSNDSIYSFMIEYTNFLNKIDLTNLIRKSYCAIEEEDFDNSEEKFDKVDNVDNFEEGVEDIVEEVREEQVEEQGIVEEEEVVEIQEDDGEVKKENLEVLIKILEEGSNPQVVHDKALLLFGQEYLSGVEAVAKSNNITLEKVLTLLSKPVVMYALKRMQPKTEGEL